MDRLTILYDARCGLCTWARGWLLRQPTYLALTFIPAGSELAARLFPGLVRPGVVEELIVVGDDGGVYRDENAWIMCLYATVEYREWSLRLARPALWPLARQAFALISRQRRRISRWLSLASEADIAETLHRVSAPACVFDGPSQPAANHPA